jgi:hypothetical protein
MQAIKEVTATEKIIGTRYHLQDLYGQIMHEKLFDAANISVVDVLCNNKSIYPFYTMKDIARMKRRMGDQKFSTQMRNKPVAEEGRIFVGPYPLYDEIVTWKKYYMSIDPAATANHTSDKTGISIAYVDVKNPSKAYFEESYGVKKKPNELADEIVDKIIRYRPVRVGIELGLQQALQTLIDIKIREREGDMKEHFRPHFVAITTGKTDKALKLERTIGAMVRDRRALFPGKRNSDGDLEPCESMRELFLQMDMYNPMSAKNDDDVLDSAGMMFQTIEHFAPSHWFGVNKEASGEGLTMEYIRENFSGEKKIEWSKKFA